MPAIVARIWNRVEPSMIPNVPPLITPRFSSSSPTSLTLDPFGIRTATRPCASPWKGWKSELRNQRTTIRRISSAIRNGWPVIAPRTPPRRLPPSPGRRPWRAAPAISGLPSSWYSEEAKSSQSPRAAGTVAHSSLVWPLAGCSGSGTSASPGTGTGMGAGTRRSCSSGAGSTGCSPARLRRVGIGNGALAGSGQGRVLRCGYRVGKSVLDGGVEGGGGRRGRGGLFRHRRGRLGLSGGRLRIGPRWRRRGGSFGSFRRRRLAPAVRPGRSLPGRGAGGGNTSASGASFRRRRKPRRLPPSLGGGD